MIFTCKKNCNKILMHFSGYIINLHSHYFGLTLENLFGITTVYSK